MFQFAADMDGIETKMNAIKNASEGMDKALQQSVNRHLYSGRRRTDEEIRSVIASNRTKFFNMLHVDPATKNNTTETISGVLKIDDSQTIPLSAFQATQTATGVEVKITRGGAGSLFFPHAFGPKINRLGNNIYRRIGTKRFPIEKLRALKAISIPGVKDSLRKGTQGMRTSLIESAKQSVKEWLDLT